MDSREWSPIERADPGGPRSRPSLRKGGALLAPTPRRFARALADGALGRFVGSWNRSSARRLVALTLDDGPDSEVTPPLIDILAELEVQVTFFLLTLRAERLPGLVTRLIENGHEVALHGLDHRRVGTMSTDVAHHYLASAKDRLEQVCGHPVTMFRPPYGAQSISSVRGAIRAGLQPVVWNGDAADWEDRDVASVTAAADAACRPGGIFLFHERLEPDPTHPDANRATPVTTFDRTAVIGDLVVRLRARGVQPSRVADLARHGRMHRTAWLRP